MILDQVLVHPREVFRAAIVSAAHAILVMHNHPGGDPTPSEADILAVVRRRLTVGVRRRPDPHFLGIWLPLPC